ncbi:MAG: CaiB/BaiF CoA-transferase family protein [Candidatus Binatus sp.]|uniref:CaiB/BaiF CoA transferase family protein n=1 Tax=Candidatus Binatus sp. TaxID=2811406 RepID=UPI00271815E2|nr:CaiB/BaiF CoA-transferase family protein [Candidatus Binatus sp.]MDO8431067.1 CaiB/BaiF CoA-transferase family protein [Candidatus Binatus sp.]
MLSPYRVLDLTTERGLLCGQILGDLGADVIKIEPPGGSPARRLAPFFEDRPDPDRSIYWWAYNRNKRSVTLNLETDEGREMFYRLAAGARFLIESHNPGYLSERRLGYKDLASRNRELICVSITPFGQHGPKASYADSDLVILAAGGPLMLYGDEDRPPVRLSVPQAYLHACGDAAAGAMVANHECHRSGMGQHVDVAAQQSVTLATQANNLAYRLGADEARRMAGGVKVGSLRVPLVWRAKDGHVTLGFLFGRQLGVFSQRLMNYLHELGVCDAATRDKDWIGYGALLASGEEPMEEYERVLALIADFLASRTKAELFSVALERGFLIAPIATVSEVLASPQLKSRQYWQMLEHPELGRSFPYPGPFAKFSEAPIVYRRRPPLVGEHNHEVYSNELGLSAARIEDLARRGII